VGELGRVLKPGAWAYFLVGDSLVGERAVVGYEELERAARSAFTVAARASQSRGAGPRREHLVALRRRD
jgi:hypothetical protein